MNKSRKILNISKKYHDNNILNEEFKQDTNEKYIKEQKYFCNNINDYYIQEFENEIKIVNVRFLNKSFNMYVIKHKDVVSSIISKNKNWEPTATVEIIKALNYFSKKKNIKNEDIYILDLGANIGWYSFFLGKYGYKVISFEPSKRNFYILKKNYCLNNDVNITLINKGLNNEEMKCDYYIQIGNEGNGLTFCDKNAHIQKILRKKGKILITKLSNYIPFLSQKNLVFIKVDVEGSEAKLFEGGIEIITKYHVPFIFLEFAPNNLKMQGTNKKKFLQLFEDNGYKISIVNFLSKKYIPINEILKTKRLLNLYIIYTKVLE